MNGARARVAWCDGAIPNLALARGLLVGGARRRAPLRPGAGPAESVEVRRELRKADVAARVVALVRGRAAGRTMQWQLAHLQLSVSVERVPVAA